jgi:hypothetical protein
VVVADRTELPAFLSLVEFRPAGIHLGIDPPIAPLSITTIQILFADTGTFCTVHRTALAFLAGIVVVTNVAHLDRTGRVTARELAVPALALMATTDQITARVVCFLVFALVQI